MAAPRVARARELAVQLTDAGINATADPREVAASGPIVLVGPPRLSFETHVGALATWRLMAIAGTTDQLVAWEQIDELVEQLLDTPLLAIETAEAVQWALAPGQDPRPAYAVTYIETVE